MKYPDACGPHAPEGTRHTDSVKRRRVIRTACCLVAVCGAALACCLYFGLLQCNYPSPERFPIRGVDVSHHQGEIDWPLLAAQNIRFVYMKATEGGDFQDPRFVRNWVEARKAGLAVGAYHFFRSEKTGAEQAQNFIRTVPVEPDALPPVLDVECPVVPPGKERDAIRARIAECLERLATHYGKTPVLYTTYEAYEAYILGDCTGYPLWIRSVFTKPDEAALERDWLLWQFSSRMRLRGYSGPERYIDVNVFNGKEDAFLRFQHNR